MLIKRRGKVINLYNVTDFSLYSKEQIKFYHNFWNEDFQDQGHTFLSFDSEEERDKAFEEIIDAYRWQRLVCDLC
jgi:hypothetical protein